jgi:hypothetical protein
MPSNDILASFYRRHSEMRYDPSLRRKRKSMQRTMVPHFTIL